MKWLLSCLESTGHLLVFGVRVAATVHRLPSVRGSLARELVFVGARSMGVVAVSGACIGAVVAVQFHDTLVRFGSVGLLGSAVGLSLVRELAPLVTALMVIARAGSSTAAELGIMRVENQVDALDCMAIDPYRFLALPKLTACVLGLPLLVALFATVGIFGGYAVGGLGLGVGAGTYFEGVYSAVGPADLAMGFVKALAFGLILGWICIGKGFLIHLGPAGLQGAAGVSRNTTEGVVGAALGTLFADYLISAVLS